MSDSNIFYTYNGYYIVCWYLLLTKIHKGRELACVFNHTVRKYKLIIGLIDKYEADSWSIRFFQVIFLSTHATGINDNTVYINVSRIIMVCTQLRYWQCSPLTHREPYCFKFPFWVKIINRFLSTHLGGTACILVNIMANYQLWSFQASETTRNACVSWEDCSSKV